MPLFSLEVARIPVQNAQRHQSLKALNELDASLSSCCSALAITLNIKACAASWLPQ